MRGRVVALIAFAGFLALALDSALAQNPSKEKAAQDTNVLVDEPQPATLVLASGDKRQIQLVKLTTDEVKYKSKATDTTTLAYTAKSGTIRKVQTAKGESFSLNPATKVFERDPVAKVDPKKNPKDDPSKTDAPKIPSVFASVETTLATDAGHIRQMALDGDPDTYFASAKNAGPTDHFTVIFDTRVAVKTVSILTGLPQGDHMLDAGILEISLDGKTFQKAAKFEDGAVQAKLAGKAIQAIRIKPTADLEHPLVIREITVDSDPKIATFRYPVEFIAVVTDAPEMKVWTEMVCRLCERHYGMICEELKSDGFKPHQVITMTMKTDYDGVAKAGGSKIVGSVAFFKSRPADYGAMIHEAAHCVQSYRVPNQPGWLVEGIADYIRFFKYEQPGKIGPLNPQTIRYNDSYRKSASFLNFLNSKYDKEFVRKLNKMLREGEYKESIFEELTGKAIPELEKEWLQTIRR